MGTDGRRWGSGERAGSFTLAPGWEGNFTVGWGSGERAGSFTLAPGWVGNFTVGWGSGRVVPGCQLTAGS